MARLINLETHREVFGWVLGLVADRGLLKGQRLGIDATTLEANAAVRSIVRRDTGESYEEFLVGLAKLRGSRRQPGKSWRGWAASARSGCRTKSGRPVGPGCANREDERRTHLAHKAEHAVDLDTGAVVAVTLQGADQGDTTTVQETLCEAGKQVAELVGREAEQRPDEKPKVNVQGIEEVVADKGYHSGAVAQRVKSYEVRTYIPEKKQKGRRRWQGKTAEQQAVYQNRRRSTWERSI